VVDGSVREIGGAWKVVGEISHILFKYSELALPQAGVVSRIRRRIFVRRQKVRLAESGLYASWIAVLHCWAGDEQQAL